MTKFLSGRQKNLKIGITSYSENTQVLEVIGRVGIGSTVFSADYDLDVRGTSRFSGNITLGANLYPDTDGLYDVGRAPQIGLGANRWKDANFLGKGTFGTGVSAHNIELGVSSANLIYSTSGNLELNSQSGITNIDDIVTISGNTGIGTANPTSTLTVQGDVLVSGVSTIGNFVVAPVGSGASVGGIGITYYGDGSNLTGTIPNSIVNIDTNKIYYPLMVDVITGTISTVSVSSTSLVFNPGTDSLGIGTTNPTSKLQVVGDITAANILPPTDNIGVVGNTAFTWSNGQFTNLTISDTLTVRNAIDLADSDILRFGTSDDVQVFYDGTANDLEIELESAANQIAITDNGTYKVVIKKDGSVGIGTSVPTSKLHVVGDTYISGILTATDINSASDIRLKTNIKSFENTLEKIIQINGVSFNWIDSNAKSGGIIAQDVEKVFPELVNDGDHKTVNYNGLIGVLVESIKELKQEVEYLKSRLS
jgi:hypothetical protein